MHKLITLPFSLLFCLAFAQNAPGVLSVEKIMSDPKWMGSSPENVFWGADGKTVYFTWNPEKAKGDSLYKIKISSHRPEKVSSKEKNEYLPKDRLVFNQKRTETVWVKNGDVYYQNREGKVIRITETLESELNPVFGFNDTKIVYMRNQNLFAWDKTTGTTQQLTNFTTNAAPARGEAKLPQQEAWLTNDQLSYMEVLKERKLKREAIAEYVKLQEPTKPLKPISLEGKMLTGLSMSNDGRFISYTLFASSGGKRTSVPEYVTESGFTTEISSRPKVGTPQGVSTAYVFDRKLDTVYPIRTDLLPGIKDIPEYIREYPSAFEKAKKDSALRNLNITSILWSPSGKHALVEIRATDNKDRWLSLLDTATHKLKLIDRQHDEAWIGGPGTFRSLGWIDDETLWFQSEATGYAHLYSYHIPSKYKKELTKGNYEVQQASLSNDKKSFYIITNEVHPGEKHFYRLTIATGKQERLTFLPGANEVSISPDEKYLAIRHSYINQPWELYLQENKPNAKPLQITHSGRSDAFNLYHWRTPDLISFKARDGADVYARVYKPTTPDPAKPAVLFVHGAGYLQNAHKWWSSYFREYMFNNLLADNGYYVMDIDYRGSAGYGKAWRTGIYRHMGGKDLSDHVDAVQYMVKNYDVNPANVGLYGGSYGGFITLMGLFTAPETFRSGAALRPVTDWANYNHGYTANILNEPFRDSLAYRRSSPIYFANGLKGNLLICHGMVDVNVHYQDVVKLSQRLIELRKDNWELASYPMEDHGFVEPSSWTDEYKRIFKLFETTLKAKK